MQAARTGIEGRCYEGGFSAFRIDEDDTWHLVSWRDRDAMYADRHESTQPQ